MNTIKETIYSILLIETLPSCVKVGAIFVYYVRNAAAAVAALDVSNVFIATDIYIATSAAVFASAHVFIATYASALVAAHVFIAVGAAAFGSAHGFV